MYGGGGGVVGKEGAVAIGAGGAAAGGWVGAAFAEAVAHRRKNAVADGRLPVQDVCHDVGGHIAEALIVVGNAQQRGDELEGKVEHIIDAGDIVRVVVVVHDAHQLLLGVQDVAHAQAVHRPLARVALPVAGGAGAAVAQGARPAWRGRGRRGRGPGSRRGRGRGRRGGRAGRARGRGGAWRWRGELGSGGSKRPGR